MNIAVAALVSCLGAMPVSRDTVIVPVPDTTGSAFIAAAPDTSAADEACADSAVVQPDTAFTVPDSLKKHDGAFIVGERLVFDIAYGILKAGTATMGIPDTQLVKGRMCYHVVTTAESNKFVSTFFKVRDRVETFIDKEGLFPWKFIKKIREGHYSADKYVEYDQVRNIVVENRKDTLSVQPFVQGILSSFYLTRLKNLVPGTYFDIDNYGDGKMYPLRVLVHKRERVKVPAGTFDCILVEPVMRVEGIFKQKGKLRIWLTDDQWRMPVLMKSKALIGSISVRLVHYTHGNSVSNKHEE